jgi:hypothetical protein
MCIRATAIGHLNDPTEFQYAHDLLKRCIVESEILITGKHDRLRETLRSEAMKGLQRLDDMLRPAIMPGVLSDMLTASMAKHSRVLKKNRYPNGHPDLIVQGIYQNNPVKSGAEVSLKIFPLRKNDFHKWAGSVLKKWVKFLTESLGVKLCRQWAILRDVIPAVLRRE